MLRYVLDTLGLSFLFVTFRLHIYRILFLLFFFNDTATTEIYTLSLHDALPIWAPCSPTRKPVITSSKISTAPCRVHRSEEHTSELQSLTNLVCRLLLEKKKKLAHSLELTELEKVARQLCQAAI